MKYDLKSLWLAQTIYLIESEKGSFNDIDANREAIKKGGTLQEKAITRALYIAEENQLDRHLTHWFSLTKWVMAVMVIVAAILGLSLGLGALVNNPVNLFWALLCLLGIHLLTFLVWLLSLFLSFKESPSVLAKLWQWIMTRCLKKETLRYYLPAFMTLFGKRVKWWIGALVNGLWSLMLFMAMVVLILSFSTQYFSFEWKTTLLNQEVVTHIIQSISFIPSLLGAISPSVEMIQQSSKPLEIDVVRSSWAIWLISMVFFYGFMIRFIAWMICLVRWKTVLKHPNFELDEESYLSLQTLLERDQNSEVIDKEFRSESKEQKRPIVNFQGDYALVGIEITTQWTPPDQLNYLGTINGRSDREWILGQLSSTSVKRLLVAIDTDRTPDRGMISELEQLGHYAETVALLFINQGRQYHNWQQKLEELSLHEQNYDWLKEPE